MAEGLSSHAFDLISESSKILLFVPDCRRLKSAPQALVQNNCRDADARLNARRRLFYAWPCSCWQTSPI